MFDKEKHPIQPEWEEYYIFLEALRRTGTVNMFGSGPIMQECFPDLSETLISAIFCSWAANYEDLAVQYNWNEDWKNN